MLCAIWYHFNNYKNVEYTHRGVLSLVKLQALACYFTEGNIHPLMFFRFFKLYKWYQIAQCITYKQSPPNNSKNSRTNVCQGLQWVIYKNNLGVGAPLRMPID